MSDHSRSPELLHWLDLTEQETDAERLSRARRATRAAEGAAALGLAGSFAGETFDAGACQPLVGLLLDAPLPVYAAVSGPVGSRGLPLLLCADRIALAPDARVTADWRGAPGLAPLMHHRLGPRSARAVLFDPSADPLAVLVACGLAVRSTDPTAELEETATALGGLGSRFRRALRAASELPLNEALSFDTWFTRSQQGSLP